MNRRRFLELVAKSAIIIPTITYFMIGTGVRNTFDVMRIYSGNMPISINSSLLNNQLLAEIPINGDFSGDCTAVRSGIAEFFRMGDLQGRVGVGSGYELNLDTTRIINHDEIDVQIHELYGRPTLR